MREVKVKVKVKEGHGGTPQPKPTHAGQDARQMLALRTYMREREVNASPNKKTMIKRGILDDAGKTTKLRKTNCQAVPVRTGHATKPMHRDALYIRLANGPKVIDRRSPSYLCYMLEIIAYIGVQGPSALITRCPSMVIIALWLPQDPAERPKDTDQRFKIPQGTSR